MVLNLYPRTRLQISLLILGAAIAAILGIYFLPQFFADELYPLPEQYVEPIRLAAAETGLPPERIAATIRHESNWREKAISPGNARGLMQIIPSVGRALVARHMPGTQFSLAVLEVPANSIRLGSIHLAGLHGRYHGDAELALAGYNAGGGFADRFVKSKTGLPRTAPGAYARRILNTEKIYLSVHSDALYPQEVAPAAPDVNVAFWTSAVEPIRTLLGL